MTETPVRIGVIGAGPRGVITIGRLCANTAEIAGERPVVVHLIDPYLSRGGRVWNTGQHRSMLMNTVTGDVTVFTDKTVTCAGPLHFGPTLYQWARRAAAGEYPGLDHDTLAEAARLEPWSYASRAFQGSYLRWALGHFIDNAPDQVTVVLHESRAVRLEDGRSGQLLWLHGDREPLELDSVVLNQGHFDITMTERQAELDAFASWHGIHVRASGESSGAGSERDSRGGAGDPSRARPELLRLPNLADGRAGRSLRTRGGSADLPAVRAGTAHLRGIWPWRAVPCSRGNASRGSAALSADVSRCGRYRAPACRAPAPVAWIFRRGSGRWSPRKPHGFTTVAC